MERFNQRNNKGEEERLRITWVCPICKRKYAFTTLKALKEKIRKHREVENKDKSKFTIALEEEMNKNTRKLRELMKE